MWDNGCSSRVVKTQRGSSADVVVQRLVGDGFGGSSVAHLGVLVLVDRMSIRHESKYAVRSTIQGASTTKDRLNTAMQRNSTIAVTICN